MKTQAQFKLGPSFEWRGRAYKYLVAEASEADELLEALNAYLSEQDEPQEGQEPVKRRGRPPKS